MTNRSRVDKRSRRQATARPTCRLTPTRYTDFVIQAERRNARSIVVNVSASPVNATQKPVNVLFSESEAKA